MADKVANITLLPHPIDRNTDQPKTAEDSRTEGQLGTQPVWKVWCTVPWSGYPDATLVMPRNGPEKPAIGTYRVELNRGSVKRNKDGSENDWDYFWNPISWTLLEEQPAPISNNGQTSTLRSRRNEDEDSDKRDRSMAISYAKDLCVAGKIERTEMYEVATGILAFIVGGPEAVMEEE